MNILKRVSMGMPYPELRMEHPPLAALSLQLSEALHTSLGEPMRKRRVVMFPIRAARPLTVSHVLLRAIAVSRLNTSAPVAHTLSAIGFEIP